MAFSRHSQGSAQVLFQIELEGPAFDGHAAGAHFIERAQHPPLASERLVGEADDQPVGRGDRRTGPDLPGDLDLVAQAAAKALAVERLMPA